jgi:hypothetical protein
LYYYPLYRLCILLFFNIRLLFLLVTSLYPTSLHSSSSYLSCSPISLHLVPLYLISSLYLILL